MTEHTEADADRPDDESLLRALDAVTAPDLWPEAEARAERGEILPLAGAPRPPSRAALLGAAAAVVALVVLAAVLVIGGSDDGAQLAGGGGEPGGGAGELTWATPDLAGTWELSSFEVDGEPVDLVAIDQAAVLTVTGFDTEDLTGTVGLRWCNSGSGTGRLEIDEPEGAHLTVRDFAMTVMACMTGPPEAGGETAMHLMAAEEAMSSLLVARPHISVEGCDENEDCDRSMELTARAASATFIWIDHAPPIPSAGDGTEDPDAPVSSPMETQEAPATAEPAEPGAVAPSPVLPEALPSDTGEPGTLLGAEAECGDAGGVVTVVTGRSDPDANLALRIGGEPGLVRVLGPAVSSGTDPWTIRVGAGAPGDLVELVLDGEVVASTRVGDLTEDTICR